jgi:hypothetical protein
VTGTRLLHLLARPWLPVLLALAAVGMSAGGCTPATANPGGSGHAGGTPAGVAGTGRTQAASAAGKPPTASRQAVWHGPGLMPPVALVPFGGHAIPGEGGWHPAGRKVDGVPAVYEAELLPPGGTQPAGLAWMDTPLLAARLYSGSESPGGTSWRYSAPVQPVQAATLVAAFNGGFQMKDAHGGYYSEGKMANPLVRGAASLVIYSDGRATVGAWGTDVGWNSPSGARAIAVRQNLVLLVADGRPTPAAAGNWLAWGNTCGQHSCAASVPSVENQWRSGVGVTATGALIYALGPGLAPLQLARLLARAGVVRGMELDINPEWPVFATYAPNGKLLDTAQGPQTFFGAQWARDFITMSAR